MTSDHILEAFDIANAVDHGIGEMFFMGVDRPACRDNPRARVGLARGSA